MRIALVILALALASPALAQQKPVNPKVGVNEEPRFVGADFPSWQITQALGTTTEALRLGGTGAPICVGWQALVAFSADQRTCFCWTLDFNVRVAAPTADGGCRITDDYGRDGDGACFTVAANETKWKSPHWPIVANRPGSRGYVGTIGGGLCSVSTSTTAGFGAALRPACRVDADCTTVVGSGTCVAFTSPAPSSSGASSAAAIDQQLGAGCAYIVATPAAAATAWVEGGR